MPLSKNILIVDDDSIVLLILKEALKKLVKIDTCSNGIEALNLMALCNYPLVILDISMPYVNSINLINFLERTNKINNTKFILISSAMSDYKDIKLKNVIARFQKPIDSTRLYLEIEKFFKGE